MACTICGGASGTIYRVDGWQVDHPIKIVTLGYLCSEDCLLAFAVDKKERMDILREKD